MTIKITINPACKPKPPSPEERRKRMFAVIGGKTEDGKQKELDKRAMIKLALLGC